MKKSPKSEDKGTVGGLFGDSVFSLETMKRYLSANVVAKLARTISHGETLDVGIADKVAEAMKTWALERGATHFTHWFQPLTGGTAEKHDAFITPDGKGGVLLQFSGKDLSRGEPDASSFPSGGLRATFEARGYTAWDPTSPAFLRHTPAGGVLCIPTVFCGYHGDALDKKTPLLRSMQALSKQVCRLGRLFGIESNGQRAYATLGPEQEYFLIDRRFYERRLDLLQTGRTLFGRRPAKHQQMEDHYFGAIKPRVIAFMEELDRELWRLGVPAKTRHNEVCPAQFEIAPVYEDLNLAVDHNMLVMNMLREVADRHGFACLLHEKPFAGVNGSGKHNNWAICGPDGKNWLTPGENPHENAKFLTVICTLLKAVDTHADLLRATVASAGNDHRLGANEAPPAIVSVFLGEQLTDIIEQIEKGAAKSSKHGGTIEVGVTALPALPRDATDRNRTSPFAFTGNKFEFRAVGSSQSCAGPNVVLNTIVADALADVCGELEAAVAGGEPFNPALQRILRKIVLEHKRVLFNGDNYTAEWREEARRRGLPNRQSTPDALAALVSPKAVALFTRHGVLSERELRSRYEVYLHGYGRAVRIEAECAVAMARTQIVPSAVRGQRELARAVSDAEALGCGPVGGVRDLFREVCGLTDALLGRTKALEEALDGDDAEETLAAMARLRETADRLEGLLPAEIWPLPSYAEMLFMM
ncbi:MAG: hypothetical protein BWZ02_01880 [Lentisphaerae bacterium ADurb.BinA184]|nr:MAG: hypothetical protein BWZ02_01880 [Lentisphaerae bacterium ADurb.BinA184]